MFVIYLFIYLFLSPLLGFLFPLIFFILFFLFPKIKKKILTVRDYLHVMDLAEGHVCALSEMVSSFSHYYFSLFC